MWRLRPERKGKTCEAGAGVETGKAEVVDAAMVIILVSFFVHLRTSLQMTKVLVGYRWRNYGPNFPGEL